MLFVSLAEGNRFSVRAGETTTAIVLAILTADILLRMYTFRCLFFRSFWNVRLRRGLNSHAGTLSAASSCGTSHRRFTPTRFHTGMCVLLLTWPASTCSQWFDLLVVVLSLFLLIAEMVISSVSKAGSTAAVLARASRAGKAVIHSLRWARAVRGLRLLSKVGTGSAQAARHTTGENKKRFVDLENGFDLDLTYISRNVRSIAPNSDLTLSGDLKAVSRADTERSVDRSPPLQADPRLCARGDR